MPSSSKKSPDTANLDLSDANWTKTLVHQHKHLHVLKTTTLQSDSSLYFGPCTQSPRKNTHCLYRYKMMCNESNINLLWLSVMKVTSIIKNAHRSTTNVTARGGHWPPDNLLLAYDKPLSGTAAPSSRHLAHKHQREHYFWHLPQSAEVSQHLHTIAFRQSCLPLLHTYFPQQTLSELCGKCELLSF